MAALLEQHDRRTWLQRLCSNVVKVGPVPRHVAIIMDGNRRFAVKSKLQQTQGHSLGFEKLAETLHWCACLGIQEVTVYAFSIENFKRSEGEVSCLMDIARQKLRQLLEKREHLIEHGLRLRVWGNVTLLPKDLQQMIAEIVQLTECNSRGYLNVCMAYTSREEITHAFNQSVSDVCEGRCRLEDLDEKYFESKLYSGSNAPDLLLRTSGEMRFSDFLLWQTSSSVFVFLRVLWPELSIWHFLGAIVYFQRHQRANAA